MCTAEATWPATVFGVPGARVAALASRWHGKGVAVASPCFLGRPIKLRRRRRCSSFALCFFPTLPIISGEPSSSNQCLCRCSKASISSALSLCAQPTHQFSLISLGTATRRISSPRPVAPPSSPRRRGQRATVSLCPCRVLLRLRRNDVVLCDPLISHFDHHSYRSIAVVEDRSAVTAINVDPCHRSLSGLVLCSNVFVVSYWTFPCPLFHRFQLHFAGVA